jgi:beta-galactosidase/beta-glucuronidase
MDDSNLANTPEDYDIKVRLHAEANFTMIRNWVGMTNNKAFYEACDKYGILIWDDFWLANPSDGPVPNDNAMFMKNAIDKVIRNRYHTALVLYCGRNESTPPAPLSTYLQQISTNSAYDGKLYDGTRYYVANSAGSPVGSGGGYSLSNPRSYFGTAQTRAIRSEHGIPNVPSLDSINRMIAPEHLWPINDVYGVHDFCLGGAMSASSYISALKNYVNYTGTGVDPLAQAYTLKDFARVSQMINYENHKGLHEGLYLANTNNGALMWMSQSSWPSFVWQTYDYYYDTNAGYFGLRTGNQPIHAIWDCRTGTTANRITLFNATPNNLTNVKTVVKLYDLNGVLLTNNTYTTANLVSDAAPTTITTLTFPTGSTAMKFLKLFVYDNTDKLISENFYWINSTTYQAYTDLNNLARVDLTTAVASATKNGTDNFINITVTNDGATPALLTRVKAVSTVSGKQILPTFYSDN